MDQLWLFLPRFCFVLFILTRGHSVFISFRERERHGWVAFSYVPQQGIKPATGVCVLTRTRTRHLLVYRMMLQPTEPHWPGPVQVFSRWELWAGQVGQLVGWSVVGYIRRLWVDPWLGRKQEATSECFSPIDKHILGWGVKKRERIVNRWHQQSKLMTC